MTIVTGNGIGNLGVWGVLSTTFTVTSFSDTGFVATNANGTVTATGSGLTYASSPGPGGSTLVSVTGGTITGVNYNSGSSQQTWTGLSVSGASASNAIASGIMTNFNNLFFSGNDTFTYTAGSITGVWGYDGNDTFNISNWNAGSTSIDGGNGSDVLNITGGVFSNGTTLNFLVNNVETINLGTGADYELLVPPDFSSTVNGSALGALNKIFFVGGNFSGGGTPGTVTVIGGAGNDTFEPANGVNTFNGGGGINTVDLTYTGTGGYTTTVNLGTTGPQALGNGATVTFSNVQNLIGRPTFDNLTGDNGDNIIDGRGGTDTLNGGGGNDTIIIGSQNGSFGDSATVDGGTGTDTVVFQGPLSRYTIGQSNGAITFTDTYGVNSLTNVEFAKFSDQTISLTGPVVSTANKSASRNQTLALSSLFSVTDVLGLPITRYQLWDGSRDPLSGHFEINGVAQAAGTVIDITAGQLAQTTFVTSKASDDLQIRAFDGSFWSAADNAAWAPFSVLVPDAAPAVSTNNVSRVHLQTYALSSLFSVSDADGDTITQYQLWDGTRDPSSGHFEINNVAQAPSTVITITAGQLSQTTFVTGAVGDSLQIRASDGILWSAADNAAWATFTVSIPTNSVPQLSTTTQRAVAAQSLTLASLISVTDGDGDTMTRYQLWDSTADPNSGHWVVNGQAKAAGTIIDVTAAQLAQTSFVTGTVNDNLQIRAFDGIAWSAADNASWSPFTIGPLVNNAPVVQTSNRNIARGVTTALSGLITVSDADSDTITKYQLWDSTADPNSGHFEINSVAQAAGTIIDVTAAQLAQTTFVTGKIGDNLQIRAYDGISWSAADNAAWSPFTVTVPDAAPVVTASNVSKTHFQTTALSGLFSVTDADGDAMTKYQLWDSTRDPNSGHFEINGVAQAAGTVIDITAAQLPQTTFVTGSVNDDLQIRAFDGFVWSAADNASWAPFTVSVPAYTAPHVTTAPVNAAIGQTIALSSLITVSDADGDSTTRYQLWDSTANPLSGHWVVGGQAQAAGTVIDITAAQFNQTSFVAGRVNDNLQVRAFDGRSWSDADNAAWAPFTVAVPANHAPVLTTTPQIAMHARLMPLSGLFSVSDADSDTMTRYQLWDSSRDPNSGHWQVNGVAQAAGTVIDVTAAQLAQTFFVSGISVSDSLQIRAFDGIDWSDGDNAAWQPFSVTVATPYTAPIVNTNDVNTTAAQTLTLSSLMSVSDPDGDSMTRYQLWDSTGDPNSGHFVVNGVAKSASTVIDITSAQFAQTSFLTGTLGDSLQIRAFDGVSWSAADNASWSPFHINVS
jgi:hypothetical protein